MKTLRIAQATLAMILVVGISSNTFAFMVVQADQSTNVKVDLSNMVNTLRAEIDLGETKCEDMLAKLTAAMKDIDAKLDAGVPNEEEYLAARDAIAEMRYDLECLGNTLTQAVVGGGVATLGAGPILGGGFGTAGVAGGAGGGGLGGLVGLGLIGGGVAGVASNSSAPGFVASQSVSN